MPPLAELARGDVHGQPDVGAELLARRLDRLGDQVERGPVGVEVGREAALVAQAGREPLLLQDRLQRVVDLRARAQRLLERRRPDRRDHELLHVDVGVGVRAAVDDVHHRHRQQVRVGAADVAVEREPGRVGRGPGDGERDAEDRVGAQLGLVGGAVGVEHRLVDEPLVVGVEPLDRGAEGLDHRVDGGLDALAEVAVAAVAQLDRLERAGGRATGDGRAGEGPVVEEHLDLDGGVAARVEDLAGADSFDGCHGWGAPGSGKSAEVRCVGRQPSGAASGISGGGQPRRRTASRRACSGSTPSATASSTRASSRSPRSAGSAGAEPPRSTILAA